MKLYALECKLLVTDALNDARRAIGLGHPRRHFKALWKSDMGTGKRMIPGHRYCLWKTSKDALGIVNQGRGLAVEIFSCRANFTTIDVEYALSAEPV
jgi:hypothetical protein